MQKKNNILFSLILLAFLGFNSCKKVAIPLNEKSEGMPELSGLPPAGSNPCRTAALAILPSQIPTSLLSSVNFDFIIRNTLENTKNTILVVPLASGAKKTRKVAYLLVDQNDNFLSGSLETIEADSFDSNGQINGRITRSNLNLSNSVTLNLKSGYNNVNGINVDAFPQVKNSIYISPTNIIIPLVFNMQWFSLVNQFGGIELNYFDFNFDFESGGGGGPINGGYQCNILPVLTLPQVLILPENESWINTPETSTPILDIDDYLKCFTDVPGSIYSVVIAADQPIGGQRDTYDNVINQNVGHTYLSLQQTKLNGQIIKRPIGFYPKGGGIIPGYQDTKPGELTNDDNHEFDVSLATVINWSNMQTLIQQIKLKKSVTYNLNTFNCTTFALDMLSSININLPRTTGTWPGGSGLNPGDVGEDIRNFSINPTIQANNLVGDQNGGYKYQGHCQ